MKSNIMVITVKEEDSRGRLIEIISHGVDMDTGRDIIMQQIPIKECDYVYYDTISGEYFLK